MVLALTLPLVILGAFLFDVLVLRVGAQALGAKAPAWWRCVLASGLGLVATAVAQVALGCTVGLVVAWFGSGASLLFSVIVAVTTQAAVNGALLRVDGVRAVILALVTTTLGWAVSAAYAWMVLSGAPTGL